MAARSVEAVTERPSRADAAPSSHCRGIRSDELPDLQSHIAERIWFTPEADRVVAHYSFQVIGGPKTYLHLWLNEQYGVESTSWGWVLHESAVLIFEHPEAAS